MAKAYVRIEGPKKGSIEKELGRENDHIKNTLISLGEAVANKMKETITSSKKRKGTSRKQSLADNINAEFSEDAYGLTSGVGNIKLLKKTNPYWHAVNYGRSYPGSYTAYLLGVKGKKWLPPVDYGSFEGQAPRGGTSRSQKWIHRSKASNVSTKWRMEPKTVRPLHYIGRTSAWLSRKWDTIIKKISK